MLCLAEFTEMRNEHICIVSGTACEQAYAKVTEEIAFLSSNISHCHREDLAKIPNILVLHFCVLFLLQENFLLNSTLFNINEEEKPCAAE